jgi:predicted Holliday junction resolvase-like endonuclease
MVSIKERGFMDLAVLVYGMLVGAVAAYFFLKRQVKHQQQRYRKQNEVQLSNLEESYMEQLQELSKSLKSQQKAQRSAEPSEEPQEQDQILLEQEIKIRQELLESANRMAIERFKQEKDQLEQKFEAKYRLELEWWKKQQLEQIQQQNLNTSQPTSDKRMPNQLLPLLPGLQYNPNEMRFIGGPIDYVIFDGYSDAQNNNQSIREIIFVDVKRGDREKSSLIQDQIKAAIAAGKVRWETIVIDENLISSTPTPPGETVDIYASTTEVQDNQEDLQTLIQTLTIWGDTGQLKLIPKLIPYADHSNGNVRRIAASALGKIASRSPEDSEIESVIPVLEKLSHDKQPQVRHYAVKALGMIQVEGTKELLQQAANDPVAYVARSAKEALSKPESDSERDPERDSDDE